MDCAWVGDESVSFELFVSRYFLVLFFEESKQRGVFTLGWHYFANRALCFYRSFRTLRAVDKNIRSVPHFMRAYSKINAVYKKTRQYIKIFTLSASLYTLPWRNSRWKLRSENKGRRPTAKETSVEKFENREKMREICEIRESERPVSQISVDFQAQLQSGKFVLSLRPFFSTNKHLIWRIF